MIVSLSMPSICTFGSENNNLSAGITKKIEETLNNVSKIERTQYVAYTTANVNIRSEPTINSEILDVIPFNSQISVFDYNDEWAVILLYKNSDNNYKRIFYINKEYISDFECLFNDYDLGENNGFKSFMPCTSITDTSSLQYKLQENCAYTGNFGIRQVNERYCVAIGTAFNVKIGTYIDLILKNGSVIPCIVGDVKSSNDTLEDNITTAKNGCVSEFIIDINSLELSVKRDGDISSCCDEWNSPVDILRIYDKNILE